MTTAKNNTNFAYVTCSVNALEPNGDDRRFFVADAKCEGIGCAYRESCGRFTRPEKENQAWASFYALADDDCKFFEIVPTEKDYLDDIFFLDFPELHQAHVLRYWGYDISEGDLLAVHEFKDCPFCVAKYEFLKSNPIPFYNRIYEQTLLLTEDFISNTNVRHHVSCGECGARGPVDDKESGALRRWNLIANANIEKSND
jgi:hypothetical protein